VSGRCDSYVLHLLALDGNMTDAEMWAKVVEGLGPQLTDG
jgi:hypothetical protein